MLLANINHHLLQRFNTKYLAQNCSAHQCNHLLPTLCLLYHICLQRAETRKGSNRDYSLFWASRLRQSLNIWQLTQTETETWKNLVCEASETSCYVDLLVQLCKMCWLSAWTIYRDRIGSEEMKLKCDDFEAKGRNVNVVTLKKCQCDDFEWCLSTIDMMIRFKVKMITSQGLLQVFTNNFILVIWSWPSSGCKVDSYTITDTIHKSIYWLDHLLPDVQKPGGEHDQRDEFLKQRRPCCTRHTRFESFIEFWCNHVRMNKTDRCKGVWL